MEFPDLWYTRCDAFAKTTAGMLVYMDIEQAKGSTFAERYLNFENISNWIKFCSSQSVTIHYEWFELLLLWNLRNNESLTKLYVLSLMFQLLLSYDKLFYYSVSTQWNIWSVMPRAGIKDRDEQLHPADTVGCSYLSLLLIFASGTTPVMYSVFFFFVTTEVPWDAIRYL